MKQIKLYLAAFPLYLLGCLPGALVFAGSVTGAAWLCGGRSSTLLLGSFAVGFVLASIVGLYTYGLSTQEYSYLTGRKKRPNRTACSGCSDDSDWEQNWMGGGHQAGFLGGAAVGSHMSGMSEVNPANGLPMVGGIGGVDILGNAYGTENVQSVHHSTDFGSSSPFNSPGSF